MESHPPDLDEFKALCRKEFSFLVSEHSFVEVPPPVRNYSNPFEVHYSRESGRIIIEGLSYGFDANILIQSPAGLLAHFNHLVPDGFWEANRQGLGPGQRGDLRYCAICLHKFGGGFLRGDWSGHPHLMRCTEEWKIRNRRAWEESIRAQKARHAVQDALPLFAAGDYAGVIRLLTPHKPLLSRADRFRLRLARDRA